MSENIINVATNLINTDGRFRKDFGDIPALAESIRELGLLQPIGIDSGYRLVFGERRLKAFQHLGRDTIPARFVNLDSLLKGEYAENEFRKDFTVSERVEIGKALEAELSPRHGGDRKSDEFQGGNFSTLIESGKTRDIAAKAAGFGNGKTYEQAKTVIDEAPPSIVAAVDSGAMSINMASKVVDLPMADINEIASAPADQVVDVAKDVIKRAHVANNSGNNEWYTPADYIELARQVMGGIDTDPATSEIANRTVQAAQIFTAEDNGLTKQWSGFKWLNPAPCNCGVAPKPIESGDGYENLPELSKSLAAHVGLLLAESGDAISGFLVQRLQPRKGQEAPSRTPRRSGAAVEVVGREGEVQPEPEGRRGKAFAEPYRQSEAACKDYRNGLGVDCGGVEPDAGGMGARLCLLREDGSAVDAGSLHSYLSSCIAGDGARKHGACLPELQFQQRASDAGRLARGQAAYCPNCGVAGYALVTPSRVFLNPPYAQPLIADFAEAVASKIESGEIEQACVLVNNGTETGWFQRMLSAASAVCFPRSRIRFVDPDGNPSGAPLQGQAVLYMGANREAFAAAFAEKGAVLFNG